MKKIIATSLLAIFVSINLFAATAPKAEAFLGFGDIVYDPVNYIVNGLKLAANYLTNMSLGVPGSGGSARVALKSGKAPCDVLRASFDFTQATVGSIGVETVLGTTGELSALTLKISALTATRTCYEGIKIAQDTAGTAAGVVGGIQVLDQLNSQDLTVEQAINATNERLDQLLTRREAVIKEIWKSVAVRILMNVQQKITTNLLNNMISKYKISDYQKYGDAVATQVYTTNYIANNYTDGGDQMIMKSLMQSDFANGTILPMVRTKVDESLGFVPDQLDISSPDYYMKLSQASANPYLTQTVYQDKLDSAKAAGKVSAQQEIASGNGFMPVRNINGAVAQQQQQIDSQRIQLQKQLQIKMQAYTLLKNRNESVPGSVAKEELDKAQQDILILQSALNKLAAEKPSYKQVADGITNPAGAVSGFLNSYLQSHLNTANSPKTENLPFFAGFVENVATNFITSFIEQGKPNFQILNDAGITAGNIVSSNIIANVGENAQLKAVENNNSKQSLVFLGYKQGTTPGQYALSWDASGLSNQSSLTGIIITGPGGFKFESKSIQGKVVVTAPANAPLTISVYAGATVVTSAVYTIPTETNISLSLPANSNLIDVVSEVGQIGNIAVPPPPDVTPIGPDPTTGGVIISQNKTSGSVAGAYTENGRYEIRGAIKGINPRGR